MMPLAAKGVGLAACAASCGCAARVLRAEQLTGTTPPLADGKPAGELLYWLIIVAPQE